MGLVQRRLESAGLSTLSLSIIADVTSSVGAPRVTAIEHPGSQPLGPPYDVAHQHAVLAAALDALVSIGIPGTTVHLPFRWPKGNPIMSKPRNSPPIAKLIRRRPWLLAKLMSGDIPS